MSVRVLSWVLDHSPVQHRGDLLTLIVLADHAHDGGAGAYPTVETIARKSRLTTRGARLALRKLEAIGAIERTGVSRSGSVVYRVLMAEATSSPEVTSPGSGEPTGGNSPTAEVSLTSPEPSVEPSGNHQSSLRSDTARSKPEPDGFAEWLAYHSERSGRRVPRERSEGRKKYAATFGALLGEGHDLEDFKLATDGVVADPWKRENGHDKFETVLRRTKFGELVEDGRRARTPHLRPVPSSGITQEWKRLGSNRGAA